VPDNVDECADVAGTVANNGCPEVSEAIKKALSSYAKTILFDTGKATIKFISAGVLNDIFDIMEEYPNARFMVEGYTDNTGSEGFNMKLSKSRANSVIDYLTEKGVDAGRLDSTGYGEQNPLDSNKTEEGRANNRRVEISHIK
jgi:outer membrane protein OmpA-like peptidoglycan-associated protein